ncbi:hypothetical protein A5747_04970 [Mycobacterium sp. IS-836]|uniref:lipoprotein LpqH n=1 Tax=Mycobacterium sp. IS-836 TaxID=1834160 RepID=UPI00096F9E14|nr:lipoprotein LpqH [Mycobacterium sp. IS-836]OMC57143.1 hypothetical protein A5747_04970 [Mycobacterium sp. IS-836]
MGSVAVRQIVVGAVVLAAALSACSTKSGAPPASSSAAVSGATVMLDQHTHTIYSRVDCSTSAAKPTATPAESGDLTTRITVHDDAASISLALSDEKPPSVDGFAISLKVDDGQYQLPYQSVQTPTQVQASKEGKSYTVTGAGQGSAPGQSSTRQVTFGIHVTCP